MSTNMTAGVLKTSKITLQVLSRDITMKRPEVWSKVSRRGEIEKM